MLLPIVRFSLHLTSSCPRWFFKSPPRSAPIAPAGFAVPLGHAFPILAVGENRLASVDGPLALARRETMDDGNCIR